MEELEKNKPTEGGKNHGRRRRHRHGKGGGNGGQAQNHQNAQNSQNKPAQNEAPRQKQQNSAPQGQKQNKPASQGQGNQNKSKSQQGQKQQNNQPQGGKSKQKNKGGEKKNNEQQRKDTYAYVLDGNLYLNLTNKCSNGCDFCVRNERASYYGNYLWLTKGEPTVDKVIAQINGMGDLGRFKEAVFCGFGEPTYRVAEMVALADWLHEKGIKTRLNTNGQGNLINKRDIVPELVGKIDLVNVSLNASCYEKYQKICRSQFREAGFDGMIEFAKGCKKKGINVRFSIVDCIGEEEVEACKRLAASANVPLHIRSYITDS